MMAAVVKTAGKVFRFTGSNNSYGILRARPRAAKSMSSQNIESVLIEERRFPPSTEFTARARLKPAALKALHAEAAADYEGFWARQAQTELRWHKPFSVTLDESKAPNYRWFVDGELNVSYNCLDVHLEERGH